MGYVFVWLGLVVAFVIAEALTTQFISIWFAVGSLVGLFFGFISAPSWLQFLAFAVTSAILLALTKPLVRKLTAGRSTPTNADRAIGETALVVMEIAGGLAGQVKINGLTWSAVSPYDVVIPVGDRVIVRAIEGVKLIVEPISEKEILEV